MRKPLAIAGAIIVSFTVGLLISVSGSTAGTDSAYPPIDLPAAATQIWFPPLDDYDTGGDPLDDARFGALMAALDEAMTADETLADIGREANVHLWSFFRRLAVPTITDEQKERVSGYLTELGERHPDHADAIASNARHIDRYAVPSTDPPPMSSAIVNYTYQDWFNPGGKPFSDAQVDGLIGAVATALNIPEAANDFEGESRTHFSLFANRLQAGVVSDEQHTRIVDFFNELKAGHPESAEAIDRALLRVESFTPGRVAPNIVGKDTEGVEFALEDYRGNIVVLIFSGEWCGPCIGEYPYHHFILEQYEDEPLVLLGVNSDGNVETIREAKASGRAPAYRTWWDGHAEVSTSGPIATTWGVTGWPAIYVIDEEGVIRHVRNTRGGNLIATVERMLRDLRMRQYQGPAGPAPMTPATPASANSDAETEEGNSNG